MSGWKAKHQFIDMARFRVLLRCRRIYHAVQGQCVNVGEPAPPGRGNCRGAYNCKGGKQTGGWQSYSRIVSGKAVKTAGGKLRGANPQAPAVQGNIEEETLSIHRGGKAMGTKLERISQLSRESSDMIFTSIGHLINKELLRGCHEKMDG